MVETVRLNITHCLLGFIIVSRGKCQMRVSRA